LIFAPDTLIVTLYMFDPELVPVDVPDPNINVLGEPEGHVKRTPFIAVFFWYAIEVKVTPAAHRAVV